MVCGVVWCGVVWCTKKSPYFVAVIFGARRFVYSYRFVKYGSRVWLLLLERILTPELGVPM